MAMSEVPPAAPITAVVTASAHNAGIQDAASTAKENTQIRVLATILVPRCATSRPANGIAVMAPIDVMSRATPRVPADSRMGVAPPSPRPLPTGIDHIVAWRTVDPGGSFVILGLFEC